MLKGHQSWIFPSKPTILSTATVGGPFEAQGKIANDFDILHSDNWLEQDSFEKAEKIMLEEAFDLAVKQASLQKGDINYLITGDLMNQI
ncbi:stage V sporulation protein AD, partial [Brevibacillus laterosporus]|nr:stage V sporulation protein AD [Brevibacillus laterosporus]